MNFFSFKREFFSHFCGDLQNSFKEFLESKSVDRNKNAMFLILTRAAAESEETIERAYEEFVNMFGIQKMIVGME